MKIVINSHKKGTIALDHLLDSMRKCEEFNEYTIFVCIGGFYDILGYELKQEGNIVYIYCHHNSIDFTGLITLSELFSNDIDEHYMYMHDTCRVGEQFFKKLKSIDLTNVSSIMMTRPYSMNIGIYSQKIINEFKDFLQAQKNTDEANCMRFKMYHNEDHIFNTDPNSYVLDDQYTKEKDITGPTDYYNTGTMRVVEYYQNFDLYKIKANWGQGSWTLNL